VRVLAFGVSTGANSIVGAANDAPFEASVEPISRELAAEMIGVSWHPGCPVPISDLRVIMMNHWGFDDQLHHGELVVHENVATDIVSVFGQLFAARFPILRMERIEFYDGDDEASMAADNTSAFNCREIAGGGPYSIHSWGKAIDINPLENPYIKDGIILPPAGATYLDRDDVRPGMIVDGDVVVAAFATIEFDWGGNWDRLKDYQHFEAADPTARTRSAGVSPGASQHP
jgi:D-alanyl-D-alanine carboxypeptidase